MTEIFLSWSGARSKRVAEALKGWLPLVSDAVEPWFSDKDIPAGGRWSQEIGRRLEKSNFGIICLTRDNLHSPWILFEAGALSKALDEGRVCPYLLDLDVKDLTGPLAQFQAKRADRAPTLELLESINKAASAPIDMSRLTQRFDGLWDMLEQQLTAIPKEQEAEQLAPRRPTEQVLEELVEIVRASNRRFGELEDYLWLSGIKPVKPSWWGEVIRYLNEHHQKAAASIYRDVVAAGFDGDYLWVSINEEDTELIDLANDPRYYTPLLNAVHLVTGELPNHLMVN